MSPAQTEPEIIAETQRLWLRPLYTGDATAFFRLHQDVRSSRFSGERPLQNATDAESLLLNYDHYQRYGYGRWALLHKPTRNFIGFCGLRFIRETGDTDIGFRLDPAYWHQGLATEAAFKALALGFEQYQLDSIIGRVQPANVASLRLLNKLGLRFERQWLEAGHLWWQGRMTRSEYMLQHGEAHVKKPD